jgi:hypothetical protein
MRQIRSAIAAGTFGAYRDAFLARYRITDQATRHAQRELRAASRRL